MLGGGYLRDERATVHDECEGARLGELEQYCVRIRVRDEEIEQYDRVYCGIAERTARRSRDAERAETGHGGVWLGTAGETDDGGVVGEQWEAERAERDKTWHVVFVGGRGDDPDYLESVLREVGDDESIFGEESEV